MAGELFPDLQSAPAQDLGRVLGKPAGGKPYGGKGAGYGRGQQILTVIDLNVRIRKGLPILNVEVEMKRYAIPDPYERGKEFYKNHFVCLWEVTEDKIMGYRRWSDLQGNPNWYGELVMPPFRRRLAAVEGARVFSWMARQTVWGVIR